MNCKREIPCESRRRDIPLRKQGKKRISPEENKEFSIFIRWLRSFIDNEVSLSGRIFDLAIQAFILLSLIAFSVETLPTLSPQIHRILHYIYIVTIIIFTIEYILRILAAESKWSFILSFYGIVDILSILPFYLSGLFVVIDTRFIRVLRLLRMFHALKMFRYNEALRRFYRALIDIKEELVLFFFIAMFLMYFSAIGIYYFESNLQPQAFGSVFHSLWWAVATLTTVGYGDIYPMTTGGKVFTFVVLMVGLGIVAVPSGLIAASLSKVYLKEENRKK